MPQQPNTDRAVPRNHAIPAGMTPSWPVELWRATRELRATLRGYTQFVESRARPIPVSGSVNDGEPRSIPVSIEPAGVGALKQTCAAAGNPDHLPLELELAIGAAPRERMPSVRVLLDGTQVGSLTDKNAFEAWAVRVGQPAGLTLEGGSFRTTATLRRLPGQQPPFALVIELPSYDQ